ncbi:sulfotransferase domain-containing protein [Salidesulfovibrio brasiliensis]|uniref:sulfotransferase domain-containing protein n=1 Tax=Salidesulfovibrio brasiliensis TaxID=221711 RepID=UPI000AF463CA|nr:sulfotransferase domain-containing protein [Salidesulfovibrio brasiliensis]
MITDSSCPDFLIIGAAKSGTTSLYAYLRQHPEVFLPDMKELNYFAPSHPFGIHDFHEYCLLFKDTGQAVVAGEASPAYLSSPESPQLIHDAFGESIKMIVLLRNPVDMMYSHWAHTVRDALEIRDAQEALLDSFDSEWEPEKWYLHHAYRARFPEQLKRYYDLFPKKNIKVYIYEEFFDTGLPFFHDLCDYLGVTHFVPDSTQKHNAGFMPKSLALHRFINIYYGKYFLSIARQFVPSNIRNIVRAKLDLWNGVGTARVPNMTLELRKSLEGRLAPQVRELEALLGRDLSEVWF